MLQRSMLPEQQLALELRQLERQQLVLALDLTMSLFQWSTRQPQLLSCGVQSFSIRNPELYFQQCFRRPLLFLFESVFQECPFLSCPSSNLQVGPEWSILCSKYQNLENFCHYQKQLFFLHLDFCCTQPSTCFLRRRFELVQRTPRQQRQLKLLLVRQPELEQPLEQQQLELRFRVELQKKVVLASSQELVAVEVLSMGKE